MKGGKAWNEWRRDKLNRFPDLSRANLSKSYLSEVYLDDAATDADMKWKRLSGANLDFCGPQ